MKKGEREVGDWSYERVVMVTSDHDEGENDQGRLLERKCKYIQKMYNLVRHETQIQDRQVRVGASSDGNSKVYFCS